MKLISSILELPLSLSSYSVLNSCMSLDYSSTCKISDFEPIISIFVEEETADFSWESNQEAITVNTLQSLIRDNSFGSLQRDVDDGFVFKPYDTVLIRDDIKSIILL